MNAQGDWGERDVVPPRGLSLTGRLFFPYSATVYRKMPVALTPID
jgi:hypothetical protein